MARLVPFCACRLVGDKVCCKLFGIDVRVSQRVCRWESLGGCVRPARRAVRGGEGRGGGPVSTGQAQQGRRILQYVCTALLR